MRIRRKGRPLDTIKHEMRQHLAHRQSKAGTLPWKTFRTLVQNRCKNGPIARADIDRHIVPHIASIPARNLAKTMMRAGYSPGDMRLAMNSYLSRSETHGEDVDRVLCEFLAARAPELLASSATASQLERASPMLADQIVLAMEGASSADRGDVPTLDTSHLIQNVDDMTNFVMHLGDAVSLDRALTSVLIQSRVPK